MIALLASLVSWLFPALKSWAGKALAWTIVLAVLALVALVVWWRFSAWVDAQKAAAAATARAAVIAEMNTATAAESDRRTREIADNAAAFDKVADALVSTREKLNAVLAHEAELARANTGCGIDRAGIERLRALARGAGGQPPGS